MAIEAFYDGKVYSMDYIPAAATAKETAKKRFSFACMRITDNNRDGYVLDGEDIFRVTRSRRTAVRVTGEERALVMEKIAAARTPPCAQAMGCLCAGHARGVAATAPCDTTER